MPHYILFALYCSYTDRINMYVLYLCDMLLFTAFTALQFSNAVLHSLLNLHCTATIMSSNFTISKQYPVQYSAVVARHLQ
jgi:hypothetical protein